MTLDEFIAICDKFTNRKIFKCDRMGSPVKDKQGNLLKINSDNVLEDENRRN